MGGSLTSSPREIAEVQNDYFVKKVRDLIEALASKSELPDPLELLDEAMDKWEHCDNIETLKFEETSEAEVLKYINKMKKSASYGHDMIDAKIIKAAKHVLITQITYVINLSISVSKIPNKWRIGKVIPLFKGKTADQLVPVHCVPGRHSC